MELNDKFISHTKAWIANVVVGCNFCPFAARELKRNSISYRVVHESDPQTCLEHLFQCFQTLDTDPSIETMFLILPNGFDNFLDYLKLVELGEKSVKKKRYEGTYQLASFHPLYLFAGSGLSDAANYTNRSPFPMLHILREESITRAVQQHPDAESIPQQNIKFARSKGLAYMDALKNKQSPSTI